MFTSATQGGHNQLRVSELQVAENHSSPLTWLTTVYNTDQPTCSDV